MKRTGNKGDNSTLKIGQNFVFKVLLHKNLKFDKFLTKKVKN